MPREDALPSFSAIQAAVGFPEYYAEAARYAAPEAAGEPAVPGALLEQAAEERARAAPAADQEITVEFSAADGDGSPSKAPDAASINRCSLSAPAPRRDRVQWP